MDVLGRLAIDYETNIAFMTDLGPVYALLFWRDGCIKAEIHAPGRLVQYGDMFEWTEEIFDDEDARSLIGWSLSSQVALPFDADCAIIEASRLCRGGVRFRIDTKRLLVNSAAGVYGIADVTAGPAIRLVSRSFQTHRRKESGRIRAVMTTKPVVVMALTKLREKAILLPVRFRAGG